MSAYFAQKVSAGARDVYQCEQAVGTVLVEEIVIKVTIPDFPGVGDHQVHFVLSEVQFVLPQVPMLDVRVQPYFFVVGLDGGYSGIAAKNTLVGKQQFTVVSGSIRRVGNRVGQQQIGFLVVLGRVQAQESVTEHGRRTVQVGGGEHQGHGFGVECLRPFLISGAADFGQRQIQLLLQPGGSCRKLAACVVITLAGFLYCLQSGLQL